MPQEKSVEPDEFPDVSLDEDFYEEKEDAESPSIFPESVILPLPSNIISVKLRSSIRSQVETKRKLWKGQANDALEGIQITNLFYSRQMSTRASRPSKALKLGLAFEIPKARS